MPKKVLSLGQCGADHCTISQFLESNFEAEVVSADTFPEAFAQLRTERFALVLVNRILDANGASGLTFISQVKEDAALAGVPVMLVSNYSDAQQEATARGALPGFGKATLNDSKTIDRLRPILEQGRTLS
jgi:CheY-like chemotaxis protein